MRAAILSLMFASFLAAHVRGADPVTVNDVPTSDLVGAAPQLVKVGRFTMEKGELSIITNVARFVWETLPPHAGDEGNVDPSKRVRRRTVWETRVASMPLESTAFFDASGLELTSDEAAKRIKPGAVVAISTDGEPVSPAYRRALARETLVIVSADYAVNYAMNNGMQMSGQPGTIYPGPGPAIGAPANVYAPAYPAAAYTDPSAPGPSTDQPIIPGAVPVYPAPAVPSPYVPQPAYSAPSYPSTEAPAFRHAQPPAVESSAPIAPSAPEAR